MLFRQRASVAGSADVQWAADDTMTIRHLRISAYVSLSAIIALPDVMFRWPAAQYT